MKNPAQQHQQYHQNCGEYWIFRSPPPLRRGAPRRSGHDGRFKLAPPSGTLMMTAMMVLLAISSNHDKLLVASASSSDHTTPNSRLVRGRSSTSSVTPEAAAITAITAITASTTNTNTNTRNTIADILLLQEQQENGKEISGDGFEDHKHQR